ncbi:MAG: DUF4827 family protein [Bacteroidaceae bacterium]|nr:DUF4827 family protein [Bacteroidaceae bacterium]
MKSLKFMCNIIALVACIILATSCDDTKSYAELLDEENDAVEKFLESQTVIEEIPADNMFIVGEDAPYYKLDEDGYVYMQVLHWGDGEMAQYNEVVFFRYSRINLLTWAEGVDQLPSGNDSELSKAYSFNFQNTELNSTTQYGKGVQQPLYYVPLNSRVNLIVKSKAGSLNDLTSVIPYLYNIRYFPSNI